MIFYAFFLWLFLIGTLKNKMNVQSRETRLSFEPREDGPKRFCEKISSEQVALSTLTLTSYGKQFQEFAIDVS